MRRESMIWLPLLALALLPLGACNDTETTGPEDTRMAAMSVYLTDAPGDVDAVYLEILGITLQGNGEESVSLLTESTDLIPITDLLGEPQLLAADQELNPATYSQIRFIVGDAVLVSTDGTVYVKGDPVLPEGLDGAPMGALQCPSCSQSGLKVKIPNDQIDVGEGASALVLDFDVAQSFGHRAGNSGKWVMHPVIHGTLVEDSNGDGDVGGEVADVRSILGTVGLATGITIPECPDGEARGVKDFIPTATANDLLDGEGNPLVKSGVVAEEGTFQIGALAPATYTLGYVGALELGAMQLTFTATVDPAEVTVAGEDVSGVVYTIQSAGCEAVPGG